MRCKLEVVAVSFDDLLVLKETVLELFQAISCTSGDSKVDVVFRLSYRDKLVAEIKSQDCNRELEWKLPHGSNISNWSAIVVTELECYLRSGCQFHILGVHGGPLHGRDEIVMVLTRK